MYLQDLSASRAIMALVSIGSIEKCVTDVIFMSQNMNGTISNKTDEINWSPPWKKKSFSSLPSPRSVVPAFRSLKHPHFQIEAKFNYFHTKISFLLFQFALDVIVAIQSVKHTRPTRVKLINKKSNDLKSKLESFPVNLQNLEIECTK